MPTRGAMPIPAARIDRNATVREAAVALDARIRDAAERDVVRVDPNRRGRAATSRKAQHRAPVRSA
jgi:hypothetical protein